MPPGDTTQLDSLARVALTGAGLRPLAGPGTLCCCCPIPCADVTDCPNCGPSCTPTQFHVTLSGVVNCGCQVCSSGGVSVSARIATSFNGTYVLTRQGPCRWWADFSVTQNFDTTGAGACDQSQSITTRLQLDKTGSNTWQLAAFIGCSFAFSTGGDFPGPGPAVCHKPMTCSNTLSSCTPSCGPALCMTWATGGTATLTPC